MIKPLTLLISLMLVPTLGMSNAEIMSVEGKVAMMRDGQTQMLSPGMMTSGDFSLQTEAQGTARVKLDDGTLLTLTGQSVLHFSAQPGSPIRLESGGIDILVEKDYRTLQVGDYRMKTNGFLKLRTCAQGCKESAGIYGRSLSGEVIVEYPGGRSVLRNKPFRAVAPASRPTILAREPQVFADPVPLERAAKAKVALAEKLKEGMAAFKAGNYDGAHETLQRVIEQSPSEHVVTYYLGLIELERKNNEQALKYLQQYTRHDPEGAQTRGVNQLVTLLVTNQLQNEVKQAIDQEGQLSNEPPEPNTIAVQPFSNRSDPTYAALAKGIAAMVITDLAKVPGLKVLERQKVQKLMDEIQLSKSGLVDQEALVRAGRIMRAEKVVVGSFGVQ